MAMINGLNLIINENMRYDTETDNVDKSFLQVLTLEQDYMETNALFEKLGLNAIIDGIPKDDGDEFENRL